MWSECQNTLRLNRKLSANFQGTGAKLGKPYKANGRNTRVCEQLITGTRSITDGVHQSRDKGISTRILRSNAKRYYGGLPYGMGEADVRLRQWSCGSLKD